MEQIFDLCAELETGSLNSEVVGKLVSETRWLAGEALVKSQLLEEKMHEVAGFKVQQNQLIVDSYSRALQKAAGLDGTGFIPD